MEEKNITEKTTEEVRPKRKINKGRWNLVVLGIAATVIAVITSGVSLLVYHNSGDIYLDRSRPGFLPDEQEIEDESEEDGGYDFSKTGPINMTVLEEYLKRIQTEVDAVNAYEKPFEEKILSDESLGIPRAE